MKKEHKDALIVIVVGIIIYLLLIYKRTGTVTASINGVPVNLVNPSKTFPASGEVPNVCGVSPNIINNPLRSVTIGYCINPDDGSAWTQDVVLRGSPNAAIVPLTDPQMIADSESLNGYNA